MPLDTLQAAPFAALTFEQKLERFAQVAVQVGLGLQPGQEVVLTAPAETLPLVRRIAEQAYKAGARLVVPILSDEAITLSRFNYGPDETFDCAPTWLHDGIATALRSGAARVAISGTDPSLLTSQNPDKVSRLNVASSRATKASMELITRHEVNWTIVACATPAWAAAVFPDLPKEQAVAKLWEAIFAASRADQTDPVGAWKKHDADLHARAKRLNEKRYSALHFRGPGTDLRVGLADDHLWLGGG